MRRLRRVSLLVALAIAGAGCGLVYDLSKLGPSDGVAKGSFVANKQESAARRAPRRSTC